MKCRVISMWALCAMFAACSSNGDEPNPTIDPVESVPIPETGIVEGDVSSVVTPMSLSVREKQISATQNEFAGKLFEKFDAATPNNSFVVAPSSLSQMLGLIAPAANADVQKRIAALLCCDDLASVNAYNKLILSQLPKVDPSRVTVRMANGVWANSTLGCNPTKEYQTTVRQYYNVTPLSMEFSKGKVAASVNRWTSLVTKGMISEALNPDFTFADVYAIFANVTYFNANWRNQFKTDETVTDKFVAVDGSVVKNVPFMRRHDNMSAIVTDKAKSVQLPYGSPDSKSMFAMTVILPQNGATLAEAFESVVMAKSRGQQPEARHADLWMPRFTVNNGLDMASQLKDMGVDLTRVSMPGLGKNTTSDMLAVMQSAKIRVDEKGTEAAAVTTGVWGTAGPEYDELDMRLDRPFAFFIEEQSSGAILFAGKVAEASAFK